MLKTTTKKAKENIRNYILTHYNPEYYDGAPTEDFKAIAKFILETSRSESPYIYGKINAQDAFAVWCSGLPSLLDTDYYYNRSAKEDLGNILEETEEERNRYTKADSEKMLTALIYRELMSATR